MKAVKRICAFIIGLVFFATGMLKLMDPVGAGLVVEEYFKYLHIAFMMPLAKAVGVGMALLETLLGAALLAGVWPRVVGPGAGIVILAFTGLTLNLWIANPAMDCGCFGQAVHLTHFQSFIKNLALCALWLVAYLPMRSVPVPRKVKYVSFSIAAVSILAFAGYSLMRIPAFDFTAFKPGSTLMQAQPVPSPDSPLLSICDSCGEYCDELLAEGTVLVVSAYDYDKLSPETLAGLDAFMEAMPVRTMLIGSGSGLPESAWSSDRRTLMTLNRSNGGATLFSDGLVVAKWPARKLPEASELSALSELDATEAMMKANIPRRMKTEAFLLYVTAVLLLL
ncbi:MAG: hypothetical protein IK031_02125 [Bacteroidales bacterium]|nr:hypothetical protein [Bacteroidales bacterium]